MTISNENTENLFMGNGLTVEFTTTIIAFEAAQIVVYLRENNVDTLQAITTHYTLDGLGESGVVAVTMLIAPTASQKLVVIRVTPKVQEVNLTASRAFDSSVLEERFDRTVMMVQEMNKTLGRSFKVAPGIVEPVDTFTLTALDDAVTAAEESVVAANNAAASAAAVAPIPDRATAVATTFAAPVLRLLVATPAGDTLAYRADASGTALTTAGGRNWSPDGDAYPDHWAENTTPGMTDMTVALQAAVDFGPLCDVRLLGQSYLISDAIVVTSRTDSSASEAATIKGVHPRHSIILQSDPSKDWIRFEKGFGNDTGWICPFVENIGLETNDFLNTQENTGAAIRFIRCLNGYISNVFTNGPTNHFVCENVGQMRWSHCVLTNVKRADNALSAWRFKSNDADVPTNSPKCFGNYISNCESFGGKSVEKFFHISVTDGLYVTNSHFNNGVVRVYIDPDNVNYRNTVRQCFFDNIYWDGNGSPETAVYVTATGASADAQIEGLFFTNSFFRVGSKNVFLLAQSEAGVSGLKKLSEVKFSNCEFRQFDSRYFNITNTFLNLVDVVEDIQINGCTFQDGPVGGIASHGLTGNLNAIAIGGSMLRIEGCNFFGDWNNSGEACIAVHADSENWLVNGCTFDVARTTPVAINASAGEGQSYGHSYPGAPKASQVSDEGTNANGYYRKYADGRLICTKTVSEASQNCDTAAGALYRTSLKDIGSLPATFRAAPVVQATAAITDAPVAAWASMVRLPTVSDWGGYYIVSPLGTTGRTHTLMLRAEGFAA